MDKSTARTQSAQLLSGIQERGEMIIIALLTYATLAIVTFLLLWIVVYVGNVTQYEAEDLHGERHVVSDGQTWADTSETGEERSE